ncbi:MAG: response regulator, partial [Ekhidna sp.]
ITNVFDRFYQTPHSMNDEGTGLGLALTKELVLLHSGTINVESVPNQETTFSITLRMGKSHFAETDISLESSDQSTKSLEDKYPLYENPIVNDSPIQDPISEIEDLHILVVEDNPEMSKYIADSLQDFGYHVSLATNGKEGLDFLSKQKPDLILTDWLMPEMNGFEMATEIKKSEELAFIPMIFLTARADDQDKINVLNLGVDDYLFKPFNPEELLVRIKNLLLNRQQRNQYIEENEIKVDEIVWLQTHSNLKASIDQYIEEHIKEEITGQQLAECSMLSERSLYRKVKSNTGLSLMQYVKEYRIRKARTLLENKEFLTVSEVSYAVGFNYLSHFTKSFKERFGSQPSEYLE